MKNASDPVSQCCCKRCRSCIRFALRRCPSAWTILKNAQQHLGFQLLYSTTGGKNGGGATLTPEAAALLAAYEEYCSELNTYAKTLFTEKFEQIL